MTIGIMRNGEEIDLDFNGYTESVLPPDQQCGDGDLYIASGWNGYPMYWNHEGKYLDGRMSPHEYDLAKIDGIYDAFEFLQSRCITRAEIDDWLST